MMLPGQVDVSIHRAFSRFATLDEDDNDALGALAVERRELAPASYFVREGQSSQRCALILDGLVYRQKLTVDGQRSIVSLQVSGDFIGAPALFLEEADHDVVMLTHASIVEIATADLRTVVATRPMIGRALWIMGLIETSICREWLLNVGRRNSRARIAHLLCEVSARLEATGLAHEQTCRLPMTQEQVGDALGLTAVHVNRVLKGLEGEKLIRRRKRELTIADWPALRRVADFNERYLHLSATRN